MFRYRLKIVFFSTFYGRERIHQDAVAGKVDDILREGTTSSNWQRCHMKHYWDIKMMLKIWTARHRKLRRCQRPRLWRRKPSRHERHGLCRHAIAYIICKECHCWFAANVMAAMLVDKKNAFFFAWNWTLLSCKFCEKNLWLLCPVNTAAL